MKNKTSQKYWYDSAYQQDNYFNSKEWLFRPYIEGLVSSACLKSGSTVLDVGCGQGFFSYLFHKCGMRVYGIDLSETGIRAAKNAYGSLGINFVIGDILDFPFSVKFDCVFTRSFSLYNTDNFPNEHEVTDSLLNHVRPGGNFIFTYNTNYSPSKKSESWHYHTLSHTIKHFSKYQNVRIFFISKVDTLLMRKYAFNLMFTKANMYLSKSFGLGGDLVVIVRKYEGTAAP